MKTILCSGYQKEDIYHDICHSFHVDGVCNVSLKTIKEFFQTNNKENRTLTALLFRQLLAKDKAQFPIFAPMFSHASFINEILSFARECMLYGIGLDDLPEDTTMEKELKSVLAIAFSLPLKEKTMATRYEQVLEQLKNEKDMEDRTAFEANPFFARLLQKLHEERNDMPVVSNNKTPSSLKLYTADNPRKEIEGCAYDIVKQNKPCTVILCDYDNQISLAKQIFTRYSIPFQCTSQKASVKIPFVFEALAEFARVKDKESYLKVLQLDGFPITLSKKDQALAREVLVDPFCLPAVASQMQSSYFEKEKETLLAFEEAYAVFFHSIENFLQQIKQVSDCRGALQTAYTLLQKNPLLKNEIEFQSALSIRTLLNTCLPQVNDIEDYQFLLEQLQQEETIKQVKNDFCTITSLSKPVAPKAVAYVLGCNGQAYPKVPLQQGLFDETYVTKISKYPSFFERRNLWMQQIDWIHHSGSEIFYSYPCGNYEGKQAPLSFSISLRFKDVKPISWQIPKHGNEKHASHHLDASLSTALFFEEDQKIHSSISRLERWFACPYSYFIESGLKVRSFEKAPLDMRIIGSLMHAVMEYAVAKLGKQYTALSKEEIARFIKPAMNDLVLLHPDEKWEISLCFERMINTLEKTLRWLKESEDASITWSPCVCEKSFDFDVHPNIHLSGIIDRIDETPSRFRVIDYKSSEHHLKAENIKAGRQLQLITYMMAYQQETQKAPSSAAYISLKEPITVIEAMKPAGRGKNKEIVDNDVLNKSIKQNATLKSRRIAAWLFEKDCDITDYEMYFTPGNYRYDYALIKQCLLELYAILADSLKKGDISLTPKKDACLFCDYKAICKFHGEEHPSLPLAMAETDFRVGKETKQ